MLIDETELYLPFEEFPWFRDASIAEITEITRPGRERLRWPSLDVDLSIGSIRDPQAYPLVARESVDADPGSEEASCRFLLRFSRFEHALKRAGYCSGGESGVRVDRGKFVGTHEGEFRMTEDLSNRVDVLLRCPPAREVLRGERLHWDEEDSRRPEDVTLEWLVDTLYRIRNNLFHGGKRPLDPARDTALLRAGMAVIDSCLELDAGVRKEYEGAAGA